MSVPINGDHLRRELSRRGWTGSDLAHTARISNATVSAACRGRAISSTTLRLIVEALLAQPPLPEIDALLL
jgi:transcriptional regulator with XRE-family HTH domain